MSTIQNIKSTGYKFHIERYDSAMEVVEKCRTREITDGSFRNMAENSYGDWEGVESYDQALEFMRDGYQPTVDSMKGVFRANKSGEGTRFSFQNEVQGFAPVVPLALKGVPNCMVNMTMKPIKAKVIDIYYDITASCGTSSSKIIDAGKKLLGTVIEMERQGYRFNLYAVQTYSGGGSCDMLVVKVKDARQPLDLKRISFPLTHTGFFRVIGFDWYSKVPDGKYRGGYGQGLCYNVTGERRKEVARNLFGKNALYLSSIDVMKNDKDYIKSEVENNDSKN